MWRIRHAAFFFIQLKLIVTNKVEMNQYYISLLILIIFQMFVNNLVAHKAHKTVCHTHSKSQNDIYWIWDKTNIIWEMRFWFIRSNQAQSFLVIIGLQIMFGEGKNTILATLAWITVWTFYFKYKTCQQFDSCRFLLSPIFSFLYFNNSWIWSCSAPIWLFKSHTDCRKAKQLEYKNWCFIGKFCIFTVKDKTKINKNCTNNVLIWLKQLAQLYNNAQT